MLFGKKDPRLRPADDSFRRLTAMNFAFSGLNAFVCAWAITPPNAPANPELFIGIIIATLGIASTRLYEGDPKRLKVSEFYMGIFIMLIPFSLLLSYLKWWIMLMCAAELIFLAIYAHKTKALKRK